MNDFGYHSLEEKKEKWEIKEALWKEKMKDLTGNIDVTGVEISGLIRRLANVYDAIFNIGVSDQEITSPRLAILVRLYVGEKMGEIEGINPTFLSHMQNVSKNTISSLVRGLEEQGLVLRENDANDRRVYRLKLTDAGRNLLIKQTPRHIDYLNSVASDLTFEEQKQLLQLLGKLLSSLISHSNLRK